MSKRLTYTVEQVADLLGTGRTATYDAVARGQIPGVLKVGRRLLISRYAFEAWLGFPQNDDGTPTSRAPPSDLPEEEVFS